MGEGTVDELASYITVKMPGLSGFNRRGLYRMKQFFEIYSIGQFVSPLATYLQSYLSKSDIPIVSALPTQSKKTKKGSKKVSAVRTQIKPPDLKLLHQQFVSSLMTQITWTHHLQILSKAKSCIN